MGRLAIPLGILIAAILLLVIVAQPANPALFPPKPGEAVVDVFVADHGYHAGLIVPVERLYAVALQDGRRGALATARRVLGHHYAELGWGDEGFYRHVPTIDKIEWGLAYAALTNTSKPSVLHVVGFDPEPGVAFPHSTVLRVTLSDAGFARLVARYDESVPISDEDEPEDLGPGLYGDSEFYRAAGIYNGLNDCNQWVAHLLAAAGVPASRSTSTTSIGLMSELRWRAGASAPSIEPGP